MLEGKLMLVRDDGIPVKLVNVDGQASAMDPFTCLFDTFGTANTTTKVATAHTSDTLPNNGEDGLVNGIKSDKFNNIRVTYPMVENYVINAWSKFGLVRTMMNLKGIFFFTFSSNMGMESMLENGTWLIRSLPLILRKAMIGIHAEVELKDTLVVEVPKIEGNGYLFHTIRVEHEWKPTRCSTCKVFGHSLDKCPKKTVFDVNVKTQRQVV
ncbi:zinc finger, CCHC-type containing protein [Tanacetum coccineum]